MMTGLTYSNITCSNYIQPKFSHPHHHSKFKPGNKANQVFTEATILEVMYSNVLAVHNLKIGIATQSFMNAFYTTVYIKQNISLLAG